MLLQYKYLEYVRASLYTIFCLKLGTHGQKTCESFRASFYNYVLTLYCSNIVHQHIRVETYAKTCVSFLPVCRQLNRLGNDANKEVIVLNCLYYVYIQNHVIHLLSIVQLMYGISNHVSF